MKLFKRFAAAILAGAMALAMLTACGGVGSPAAPQTDEQKLEQAYLSAFNQVFSMDKTNNGELQTKAKNYLEACVNDDGTWKDGKKAESDDNKIMIMTDKSENPLGMTSAEIAQLDPKTLQAAFAELKDGLKEALVAEIKAQYKGKENAPSDEQINEMVDKFLDEEISEKIKAIGVGAVKKGEKIYVAMAADVESIDIDIPGSQN